MKTTLNLLALGILLSLAGASFGQPVITTQPQSSTNAAFTTATFWVAATGTPPLAYQWQKFSGIWTDLAGSTGTNLSLANVQTSHAGDYRVVLTNVDGALTSDVARLTVIVPPRITPTISLQNWALDLGTASSFVVAASGTPPLSFQWRLDGRDLAGKTQNTLALPNLQPADGGDYTVVVTNAVGAVTSEPARLWVIPPSAGFIKRNFTNQSGVRLPYYYLLPTNYTTARRYPLVLNFHGSPGDETMITTPTGYATYPRLKVFASYQQQEADPTILLWPARRAGDTSDWSLHYLQLTSGLLDQFITEFSTDTNRLYLTGFSEGAHAAWDLIAMRPGLFAGAGLAAGWAGNTPPGVIKDMPFWIWCARDDSLSGSTISLVNALRRAGGNPIYTEFATGSPNPHPNGIGTGASNPAFVVWLLAQRRGVASTNEPLLSIAAPTLEAALATGATNLSLSGSAAALGRVVTRVTWTNYPNSATSVASGTNAWNVTNIPLVAGRTNVIVVVGTTTSWAPAFGGNTTFNDTLTVIQSPIRATLTWQGTNALLNWSGGGPPYRVQRATNLSVGAWTDFLPDATPPVSLPLDGTAGFYRIIGR